MYSPKTNEELKNLIKINIPGDYIDVSKVISMKFMFYSSKYNHPLGSWDVSNVESMYCMFSESQYNHPLGPWDVSKVTSTIGMFNISQIILSAPLTAPHGMSLRLNL